MLSGRSGATLMHVAILTDEQPNAVPSTDWSARLDGYVGRAQRAAVELRKLDQEAVDRIVWAMTVAGLENAVELAELAMEETRFGVLEDKVLKNYIATEFLYDYLKVKKSVGVIEEDRERAIQYVADRSESCWPCCRSPTRPRPRCSNRSSAPRRATR
jgi:acetaldehyde dehydrogenase/alcohol dehydrogenase